MIKRFLSILCLLSMIFSLTACSKEIFGVPKSVVLNDINYRGDGDLSVEISHNVDSSSHIDDAELLITEKGNFGTLETTTVYSYQYKKSDDAWELLGKGIAKRKHAINANAYINSPAWTGSTSSFDYAISFENIDTENMTAVVNCKIDFFTNRFPDTSETKLVHISDDIGSLYFLIPTGSTSVWFFFDVVKGITVF